jgi:hypothetical protein
MTTQEEEFVRKLGSFSEERITGLNKLRKVKGKLVSPFNALRGPIEFKSWKDDALPMYSWAALLVGLISRDEYLSIFRNIIGKVGDRKKAKGESIYPNHWSMRNLTNEQFDDVFESLLAREEFKKNIATLAELESLPDAAHWKRHVEDGQRADAIPLAVGYAKCIDHQSQQATDIRWLILMCHIANDRMTFDHKFEERLKEFHEYPNRGNMRSVRPSIRAMEIMTRGDPEFYDNHTKEGGKAKEDADKAMVIANEAIWQELFERTDCNALDITPPTRIDQKAIEKELMKVYTEVYKYFFPTVSTTGIDARHDTSFGIVLYAMALALEATLLSPNQLISGRLLLRSIVEAHINLHFLCIKDDKTIWYQFRNFGASQTKLALLKYLDLQEKPDYIDLEQLFLFANEDMWHEYQDIDLGTWAKKNLREIAQEAGLKNIYDKHYPILSTASHAHWPAIREIAFQQCINPLHRFHRIADLPHFSHDNLLPEMCKLLNLMLDDLNHLYPSFKPRLRAYKTLATGERESANGKSIEPDHTETKVE